MPVIHPTRGAAARHARRLANTACRPVLWGQLPPQRTGWMVELRPCGHEDELVVLTLPDLPVRARPTWRAQVHEVYAALLDTLETRETAAAQARIREVIDALLAETGLTAGDMADMSEPSGRLPGVPGRPRKAVLSPATTPERSRMVAQFEGYAE